MKSHLNPLMLQHQLMKHQGNKGFNLANYNIQSDVNLCIDSSKNNNMTVDHQNFPLKVVLPPLKDPNRDMKILTIDQGSEGDSVVKPPLTDTTTSLNVEEFECGVSVEGSEKQEWSFTLYDFDGCGKITKEDLASLLKSLYDAVGSSIKLPQTGTKTLKLRLTVAPDGTGVNQSKALDGTPDTKKALVKKDIKSTPNEEKINNVHKGTKLEFSKRNNVQPEGGLCKKTLNKDSKAMNKDGKILNKDCKTPNKPVNRPGKPVTKDTRDGHIEHRTVNKDYKNMTNSKTINKGAAAVDASAAVEGTAAVGAAVDGIQTVDGLDGKHLADLIQRNMERHQARTAHRRRHQTEGDTSRHHRRHHRHSSRNSTNHSVPNNTTANQTSAVNRRLVNHQENLDRRSYYLDLAGIEHDSKLPYQPTEHTTHRSHHGHSKSRKRASKIDSFHNEVSKSPNNIQNDEEGTRKRSASSRGRFKYSVKCAVEREPESRSRSFDCHRHQPVAMGTPDSPRQETKQQHHHMSPRAYRDTTSASPCDPNTSSPKHSNRHRPLSLHIPEQEVTSYRRHQRQREDRHLAMQQVAEWIEKEHVIGPEEEVVPSNVVVQRHEHHHIHEHHHHHHYHHYYET
ncbi:unnamed protein product [Owenia fusiformis]|nr:unnamed protein product [Owenia fusiformis]